MSKKVKEINNNVSVYLEIDESKINLENGMVRYTDTDKVESCGDLASAFLEELIESNPELLKKYGLNKISFYIQESTTQEVDA